jgi:hypothetical protein
MHGVVQSTWDVDLRRPSVFANESLIAVQGAVGAAHGAVTVASNASSRQFGEAFGARASAACLGMRTRPGADDYPESVHNDLLAALDSYFKSG